MSEENPNLLELEVYFGFTCFGTIKDFLAIKDYIEKFSDSKVLYDKKSISRL